MNPKTTVIIPAYKPGKELLPTIRGLVDIGFQDILVVDDGGGEAFAPIFKEVEANPYCTVLRHEVNRGKGAALKTAFAYFLENRPDSPGVVTADADGQHLPKDILAVAKKMEENGSSVLGVRDFSDPLVPPRSKSGNRITCGMFRLFFGMKITDTQTGLRAFPRRDLPAIATAEGDRYEFETNMLYLIDRQKLPLEEVKISTVYIDDNSSSHFRVVRDSARIYAVQLKYLAGFLCSLFVFSFLDSYTISADLLPALPNAVSNLVAKLFPLIAAWHIHYTVSATTVFDKVTRFPSYFKFAASALGIFYVTYALPYLLAPVGLVTVPILCHPPVFSAVSAVCKVVWGILIFFVSFRLQHKWVFRRKIK